MRKGRGRGTQRALCTGAAGFKGAFTAGSGGVSEAAGNLLMRKPPIEENTNQKLNLVAPSNTLQGGRALVLSATEMDVMTQCRLSTGLPYRVFPSPFSQLRQSSPALVALQSGGKTRSFDVELLTARHPT
jgi:hypothetical protein